MFFVEQVECPLLKVFGVAWWNAKWLGTVVVSTNEQNLTVCQPIKDWSYDFSPPSGLRVTPGLCPPRLWFKLAESKNALKRANVCCSLTLFQMECERVLFERDCSGMWLIVFLTNWNRRDYNSKYIGSLSQLMASLRSTNYVFRIDNTFKVGMNAGCCGFL